MAAPGAEQISPGQVTALVFLSRITLTLVYFGATPVVRQDTWWQSFPAALTGALFVWLVHWLWRRFPGQSPAQMAEAVLGRPLGRLVTVAYAMFYLLFVSLNLRLTGDFFLHAFLPRTPLLVIVLVTAFLASWAAKAGLEVMGRATQLIMPIFIGTIAIVVMLLLKETDPIHIWPPEIIHTGPLPHLQDMVNIAARTVELAWVGLLVPHVSRTRDLLRATVWAQIWQGIIWVPMSVVVFGTLGRDVELHLYPFFTASQLISIANFIERVDALILAVWMLGMVIRTGMVLWAAARETAAGLGLRDYRPLVLPLGALAASYAIPQAESQTELLGYLGSETLTPFTLLFVLIIPLVLLAVAAMRGTRGYEKSQL